MDLRTLSLNARDLKDSSTDPIECLPTARSVDEDSSDLARLFAGFPALGQSAGTEDETTSMEALTELCAEARYSLIRRAGRGGQGTVYLARREGADGFHCTIAIKFYMKRPGRPPSEYESDFRRIALQAKRSCELQHDNLVDVRDFIALGDSRALVMEWIDGVDLDHLLDPRRFGTLAAISSSGRWAHLNDVTVTQGKRRCALKPGIAISVIQQCLAGLAALHENGIIHCDVKPSNIMIKRTGAIKVIDLDSSVSVVDGGRYSRLTPYFMAPELFGSEFATYQADIASLGYTLLELLTGEELFSDCRTLRELEQAKQALPGRLHEVLMPQLHQDPHLVELCRRMIAVDPRQRFADADDANFGDSGAASFLRHLVRTDLWADYDREIGDWLDLVLANAVQS